MRSPWTLRRAWLLTGWRVLAGRARKHVKTRSQSSPSQEYRGGDEVLDHPELLRRFLDNLLCLGTEKVARAGSRVLVEVEAVDVTDHAGAGDRALALGWGIVPDDGRECVLRAVSSPWCMPKNCQVKAPAKLGRRRRHQMRSGLTRFSWCCSHPDP